MVIYKNGYYIYDSDWQQIYNAIRGYGVIPGYGGQCSCSIVPSTNVITYSSGLVNTSGGTKSINAGSITLSSLQDETFGVKALIYIDADDGIVKADGGSASAPSSVTTEFRAIKYPAPPDYSGNYDISDGDVVLSEVWLDTIGNTLESTDISDRRYFVGISPYISNSNAGTIPLVIKGASGQSADYINIKDSSGTELFKIDSTGEAHGSMIAAGDEYTVDMGTTSDHNHIAVDAFGRIITSPVDFCHFSEKLGINPTNHFHNEMPFLPDADWEMGWSNASWETDARGWSLEQGWVHITQSGYLFSHQQFRNGRARIRFKAVKPSVTGATWSVGLFETEIETMALPGPWASSQQYGNSVFLKCAYGDSQTIKAYTEHRGANDNADVTAEFPSTMDTQDFIIEIEKYKDLVRFWLYETGSTPQTTVLASFIPLVDQGFCSNPVFAIGIKNEGTAGTVSVKSVQFDPIMPGDVPYAPRKTICGTVSAGGLLTISAYSCVVDKLFVRNQWDTVSTMFQVSDCKPTATVVYQDSLSGYTTAGGCSKMIDFSPGTAFRYGVKLYAQSTTIDYTIVGAFP